MFRILTNFLSFFVYFKILRHINQLFNFIISCGLGIFMIYIKILFFLITLFTFVHQIDSCTDDYCTIFFCKNLG